MAKQLDALAPPPDGSQQILRLYGVGASIGWDMPEFAELIAQHYHNECAAERTSNHEAEI